MSIEKRSDSGPVILIVEDDLLIRMEAAEVLAKAGFAVVEASNAAEALEILSVHQDISIVFTDIQMPGTMDGLVARAVRSRWPPIELVITSGYYILVDEDLPERGLFLSKPYSPSEIISAMRRSLGQHC